MSSRSKQHPRTLPELVSADKAMASPDHPTLPDGRVIDAKNTLQSFRTGREPSPNHPTLPDGRVIDAKNTLQSFHIGREPGASPLSPPAVEIAQIPPRDIIHPTLPNGQVISAKNTLQSFSTGRHNNRRTPIDPPVRALVTKDTAKRVGAPNPIVPPQNVTSTAQEEPHTVIAVAIEPEHNIVYAELAPELVPSMDVETVADRIPMAPPVPRYKPRSSTLLWWMLGLVATGLGLYFGLSGANSNRSPTGSPAVSPTNAPSGAPTGSPTESPMEIVPIDPNFIKRAEVLTSYINNITLSNQTIAWNGTSPESLALAWMITNDTASLNTTALMSSGELANRSIGFTIRQRFPLLVMWFQQTDIEKWAITTGWLNDPEECNWYGILCEVMVDPGSGVNQSVVTKITVDVFSGYVGDIPPDIGLLSSLKHFEVKNTEKLRGTLPDSIGLWTALTYFGVRNNVLTGTLPNSIGLWTALTFFGVYGNALAGTLPDIIGQWKNLSSFGAGSNDLTGTLPDIVGKWTALTSFGISDNNLNGTIPLSIGNWSLIEYASFKDNQFIGIVPPVICQYIDTVGEPLEADCDSGLNCSCCTACF